MAGHEHNQRRAELLDVLFEIVALRGVDGVSVREVAARAGVSIGTVQHYFPTKDRMLGLAVERIGENVVARMHEITAGRSIGEGVRKMLLELLPFDTERAYEAKVWLSFLARAIFTPDLLRFAQQAGQQLEEGLAAAIERAQAADDAARDVNPARAAKVLYTLIEGISARVLIDPDRIDSAEQTAILDDYLVQVFPGLRISTMDEEVLSPRRK